MRDFRDAKAMARSIRAALATKDIKITVGESLELIAKAFGLADWNQLAAAIQSPTAQPASPPLPSVGKPRVSVGNFRKTLERAGQIADAREHEFTTLEHLLLSLADDPEAAEVMMACGVDLPALKTSLTIYLDAELSSLRRAEPHAELTASARRVLDRAAIPGGPDFDMPPSQGWVSSVNALLTILSESDSYASYFLREQGMIPEAAAKFQQREPPSRGVSVDEQTVTTTGTHLLAERLSAGLTDGLTAQERESLPLSALPAGWERTSRHERCPCGSRKWFKDCHGALVEQGPARVRRAGPHNRVY